MLHSNGKPNAPNDSYRAIWKLAYPIVLSGVAQNAIDITDTAFMGRLNQTALAAMAIVALLYFGLATIGMGLATGAQILLARAEGEGRSETIGRLFRHTMLLFLATGAMIFPFAYAGHGLLLHRLLQNPGVAEAGSAYLDIRFFGLFFAFLNFGFRALYIGLGRSQLILYTAFFMAVVNIGLNAVLVFGYLGFPAMGIRGAALASVVAEGLTLGYFALYTLRFFPHRRYHLFQRLHFQPSMLREIMAKGLPISLQQLISMAGFVYFFVLIERMGQLELATSNVLRSVYLIYILPIIGLGTAVNTLVSNSIGRRQVEVARRVVYRTALLSLGLTVLLVPVNVVFPETVMRFYTDDPQVIAAGQAPLWVLSAALLMFSVSFIYFSGVSGIGHTLVYSAIEISTVVIYLGYLSMLIQRGLDNLAIAWTAEWIFMFLLGFWSWLYLHFRGWPQQRKRLAAAEPPSSTPTDPAVIQAG